MVNGKWTVQYYQSIGVPIGGQRDTEGEFGKHLELCENNKNMTLPSVPPPSLFPVICPEPILTTTRCPLALVSG